MSFLTDPVGNIVFLANCVSHITLPHFLRLLIYSVVSMVYIELFLYERCAVLWRKRHLPSVR